jgi:hypothetical protein
MIVLASLVHRYEFALLGPGWGLKRFEAFNLLMGGLRFSGGCSLQLLLHGELSYHGS